jgi:hypothetical protein
MSVTPEQIAEIKEMLLAESQKELEALQTEVIKIGERLEIHNERVDKLENLISEHHASHKQQKEEFSEMLELVRTMKAGMRITNFMQSFFVKAAAVATAIYGLWQMFKDHLPK